MDAAKAEIAYEFLPLLRVYKDGHVERLLGTDTVPAGADSQTGVLSKDITIIPDSNVSARLYLPNLTNNSSSSSKKLPVLVYFHGGGFCLSTTSSRNYHNYLNTLVAEAQVVAVSVNYRRPPENPLPTAYEDSWAALQWVVSHRNGDGSESWLNNYADFGSVFLAGESAGANIAHNIAMAAGDEGSGLSVQILGVALVHPYFWGSDPIGSEARDPDRKFSVDRLWPFVCPSSPDNDDPRVNPVAEGAPSLVGLGCRRVLVCVAEKDVLRDRGLLYYQALGRSGWMGVVEIQETEGEDHAFHLHNLECEKARELIKRPEVSHEVLPYLRVYKDGTIERLAGTAVAPATFDSQTGVLSKDTMIIPETGVFARLYRPNLKPNHQKEKLPLLIYFHGGAFCISSISDPVYQNSLNTLVAAANIIVVSVDYRRAPEYPLPAAYDDSWAALLWVASHASGGSGAEAWLRDYVDFERVFLAGDSAGANIAHHMTIQVGLSEKEIGLKLRGIILIHPYFWGEEPIGSEVRDRARKAMVDNWWLFVCQSGRGNDDPYINPFVNGAPSLAVLPCDRVLVCVAEKDILKERGKLYYESLVKSGWHGAAEIIETEGEDHVFHLFNPNCEKALNMIKSLASFINQK
ncbi:hypothetical protein F0562_027279 [Nyssa sinensis]|uniref:Alpha/beta hydrolase fold-3 domain-containing protein n=1 Tax=Nyssa sinensis TaxID=561372 RepID=A0A5J5B957_9ASTE|nr:hypothetical protein F0562_027279 [Nyssa sinensis]